MVHFFPLIFSWLPQKHFVNVLHCSCLCSSIENPLMLKQFRSILAGTHRLRLFRSQRKSFMPHYPVLTACLFLICITFCKNLPFSWDKVTLVCGSDGRAAQMGFLVIITLVPLLGHSPQTGDNWETWGSSVHVSWRGGKGQLEVCVGKMDFALCVIRQHLISVRGLMTSNLLTFWEHSNWIQ